MNLTDDELLLQVRAEKDASLGFDDVNLNSDLQVERARALEYYKGDVSRDLKSIKGRSQVVSYDVADGIEQALPDLMEIFTREEVVTFDPVGPEDVDAAKQETDIVKHIFWQENDGETVIRTMIKDALLQKIGVAHYYWEDAPEPNEETFKKQGWSDVLNAQNSLPQDGSTTLVDLVIYDPEGKKLPEDAQAAIAQAIQSGQIPAEILALLTFDYTLRDKKADGKVCVKAWTPNDVAASTDTMIFGKGTYCGLRSRMRRQDAIEDGYDKEKILELNAQDFLFTEIETARDHNGENDFGMNGQASTELLDTIVIYYHWIKIFNESTKENELWHIVTGGDAEQVLLHKEKVEYCPAVTITPFPNPHRFYGDSMADKLMPVQLIKTSIKRTQMDAIYFAQNARHIVAEGALTEHTWGDLLNNIPGWPVRAAVTGGIEPLQTAPLNFDALTMLEYETVQGENASGVLRAGGGLNPDTLHETASGAVVQMDRGARRLRFMARNFAYGLRDLFVGIHRLYRENATNEMIFRLKGGKVVPVSPAAWVNRENMEIEVGTNGGQQQEITNMMNVIQLQAQAAQAPGNIVGPKNMLEAAHALMSASGIKNGDKLFPSPETYQEQPPADPSQSPEAMKVQAEIQSKQQIEMARIQADQQYKMAMLEYQKEKDAQQFQFEAIKAEAELKLKQQELFLKQQYNEQSLQVTAEGKMGDLTAKKYQIDNEIELKKMNIQYQAEIERMGLSIDDENEKLSILAGQENAAHQTEADRDVHLTRVELGGDPG